MSNRALFIAPCYYTGTSFERIFDGVTRVIENNNLPIDTYVISQYKNKLQRGELDDVKYIKAQARMLDDIAKSLIDGVYDRVLFIDFFNPGIDLLRYTSDKSGHSVKFASLLHGGSFVEGDIYEKGWVDKAEQLWASLYDRVYVPSEYALSQLPGFLSSTAKNFAWGLDAINVPKTQKSFCDRKFDVVFPHRLNHDKGKDDLLYIVQKLKNISFIITTPSPSLSGNEISEFNLPNVTMEYCETTEDLQRIMDDSRLVLSCAKQELFGYSVAEAVLCGCIPILPNSQVYPEMYDKNFLYDSLDDCCNLINYTLNNGDKNRMDYKKPSFLPMLQDFLNI